MKLRVNIYSGSDISAVNVCKQIANPPININYCYIYYLQFGPITIKGIPSLSKKYMRQLPFLMFNSRAIVLSFDVNNELLMSSLTSILSKYPIVFGFSLSLVDTFTSSLLFMDVELEYEFSILGSKLNIYLNIYLIKIIKL